MDYYLGVTMATIIERFNYKVIGKKKFTLQEITSVMPLIISIYNMIPTFKEEIKSKIGL